MAKFALFMIVYVCTRHTKNNIIYNMTTLFTQHSHVQ